MVTLLELFLVLVVGTTQAIPVVPGAARYEILPTRQVMHEDAPAFAGTINIESADGMIGADCSWLPYWEGETRYPCWPQRISVPANGDLSVWLSGDNDGEVVLIVRVIGYPETIYLPSVMANGAGGVVRALAYP